MEKGNKKRIKLQSALEFLVTYGFALVIIGFSIAILFTLVFFKTPPVFSSAQCAGNPLNCRSSVIVKGNSTTSDFVLLYLTNSLEKTVTINSIKITIKNTDYFGNCGPSIIPPGASSICLVNVALGSSKVGDRVTASFSGNLNYTNQLFNESGYISGTISPTLNPTSIIKPFIKLKSIAQYGVVLINATLLINNLPAKGMPVLFSASSSAPAGTILVFPTTGITDENGRVFAYIYKDKSLTAQYSVSVTAVYNGLIAASNTTTVSV